MAKLTLEALVSGQKYNFVPPEGEHPQCYGVCTYYSRMGSMLALEQAPDKDLAKMKKFDASGKEIEIAREVGKQRHVHYNSFEKIEKV